MERGPTALDRSISHSRAASCAVINKLHTIYRRSLAFAAAAPYVEAALAALTTCVQRWSRHCQSCVGFEGGMSVDRIGRGLLATLILMLTCFVVSDQFVGHGQTLPAPAVDRVGFPAGYKDTYKLFYVFDNYQNRQI